MIASLLREVCLVVLLAAAPAAIMGAFQLTNQKTAPLGEFEVQWDTAQAWGEQVLWVDVRERRRFDEGHFPNAVRLNQTEWVRQLGPFLEQWTPEKRVVVYGTPGGDAESLIVARRLRDEVGIGERVWVLNGGWQPTKSRQ